MKKMVIALIVVVIALATMPIVAAEASLGPDPVSAPVQVKVGNKLEVVGGLVKAEGLSTLTYLDGTKVTFLYEYKGGKPIGPRGRVEVRNGVRKVYGENITIFSNVSSLTYLDGTAITFLYEYRGGKAIGARGGKVTKDGKTTFFSDMTKLVKYVTCGG